MAIKMLVIDRKAIGIFDSASFEDAWFNDFSIPKNNDGIRRIEVNGVVYLLSQEAGLESEYLLINMDIFNSPELTDNKRLAFERIIRVALRHFDRSLSIPITWQPYHSGPLLSIYAQPQRKSESRIYFNQFPDESSNIYAFAVTKNPQDLDHVPQDLVAYQKATSEALLDALVQTEPTEDPPVGNFGVLLSRPLGVKFSGSSTLDEWYNHRLNKEQRSFVDQPNDQPIRLRGAAGTGKTQSMAVKCLRDLYADQTGTKTFAFITHSSALAHDVVRGMLQALDPSEYWATAKTPDGKPRLWIGTLYELAQEKLGYMKKGLIPLSLDGREGKEYQRMMIVQSVKNSIHQPRIALGLLKACPDFKELLKDIDQDTKTVDEIMNEFACILDLENIKLGTPAAEKYVRAHREEWQMNLPTEAHRRVLLEIHAEYRNQLKLANMLSMDQMIADFGLYLETHEWSQLRDRDGFELVFVDEYHYFTRTEAMTLHNLFKSTAQIEGRWPLIMAYDLKQSTNEVAISGGANKFRNPGVGESFLAELKQVYRSTPQISSFLGDLDASFPAMDLEGEFSTYTGVSQTEDGELPLLTIYDTDVDLIDSVAYQAAKRARELDDGGSQVAVLCLNDELFDEIRQAGRIKGKFVAITTREDFKELRYAKQKCVLSTPEYVAGLQFDTVFLIHANQADYEGLSQGARRRYVSKVYLGVSRAKHRVSISSSAQHGGMSSILQHSLSNGTLIKNGKV